MSEKKIDVCKITNKLIEIYTPKQKKHLKKWLSLTNWIGRLTDKENTFDELRKLDFYLASSFHEDISNNILTDGDKLTKNQLIYMLSLINNHLIVLDFRIKYNTLLISAVSACFVFFYNYINKIDVAILLLIFFVFGTVLFCERFNIYKKILLYNETKNIIKREIDIRS